MGLTDEQREAIKQTILDANIEINNILSAREDLHALRRIDSNINDSDDISAIISAAKSKAKTASEALVVLFT